MVEGPIEVTFPQIITFDAAWRAALSKASADC